LIKYLIVAVLFSLVIMGCNETVSTDIPKDEGVTFEVTIDPPIVIEFDLIKDIKGTVDDPKWTKNYDTYFRKNSKRYFGVGFNWKWWKSQAITESNLDKNAESWVHAKGLMQVMPETFKEIQIKVPILGNVWEPKWNIAAGIYYDKYLFDNWTFPRPFKDRMSFVFASYNGGMGNVLKAQKMCINHEPIYKNIPDTNCNYWNMIEMYAPNVKSWRYEESLHYVKKINKLMINYIKG